MTEKYKEIYQRLKKENPCIFCVQYTDSCQFKDCDPTSLKMYYERMYLEIEPMLRNIYIKELEEENKKLKEKWLQATAEGTSWVHLKSLENENTVLKKQQFSLRNERNTFLAQNEQYEKDLIDFNEKLTEAKEFLKWFVHYFREGNSNLVPYKHKVVEVEQFLKEE